MASPQIASYVSHNLPSRRQNERVSRAPHDGDDVVPQLFAQRRRHISPPLFGSFPRCLPPLRNARNWLPKMAHSRDTTHSMPELMTRIAVTLGVLAVYRLGTHLPCTVRGNAYTVGPHKLRSPSRQRLRVSSATMPPQWRNSFHPSLWSRTRVLLTISR